MKKNVLIITESMPYPLNIGGNIAQFEMNDVLRKHVNLKLLFPVYDGQETSLNELRNLWPDVELIPIINTVQSKFSNLFSNLLFRKPLELYYKFLKSHLLKKLSLNSTEKFLLKNSQIFTSGVFDIEPKYIKALYDIPNLEKVDIIQVEFHTLLPIITYLPPNIHSIYVNHEIRYVREERELLLLGRRVPFLNFLYARNKGYECSFMSLYDKVVTVSDDDRNELINVIKPDQVYSSPLTIKSKSVNSKIQNYFNLNKVIFLGGEDHFPNKDGVNWFLENCWDSLLKLHPNLELKIIGKWAEESKETIRNRYQNVSCLGFVEDLASELKDGIFIVPIRIGSGMRMKIIDAVQNKLPIITTTVGIEGLNFRKNIDYLRADTAEEFCSEVNKLIHNSELSQTLSLNAHEYLTTEYSYEKLIKRRLDLYNTFEVK